MPDNQQRIESIKTKLAALNPTQLEVIDDSHLHVGHPGAQSGAGHFTVIIKSPTLAGLSRIEQHRRIYQLLDDMMGDDIHALKIKVD